MGKLLTVLIVLLVLGGGAFFLLSDSSGAEVEDENVKVFDMTGENFKFVMDGEDNPEIRVQEGDRVRIEFTSTDGLHDWVLDEFNAATTRVNTGESTFVEFTAGEPGTYEYYCSVGQHRENGMEGTFIVE